MIHNNQLKQNSKHDTNRNKALYESARKKKLLKLLKLLKYPELFGVDSNDKCDFSTVVTFFLSPLVGMKRLVAISHVDLF